MFETRKPSPARSHGAPESPRRHQLRKTRSVGSPARSTASGRLSSIIPFQEKIMDSFNLSPMPTSRSVLNDDTDIEEPRRRSWWKKLSNNSRDVLEVLNDNNIIPETNEAVEEYIDIEVLSQEKKNYTMDIPESSDNESISSIVIPQRKLFTQKENQPQKKFGQLIGTRESLATLQKTTSNDKTLHVAPKKLFNQPSKPKSKPIFPSALLNFSPNKTVNKTKEMAVAEPRVEGRTLFGNRAGTKRKNMFADFIVSESEDDISEIQPRIFGFQNKGEQQKEASNAYTREQSPTSSIATDHEMDEWKLLPSSTMVENQLEDMMATGRTPIKRARLTQLIEDKETENRTKLLNQSKTNDKSVNHSESLLKNKSHVKDQKQQAGEKEQNVSRRIEKDIHIRTAEDVQQQGVGLLQNEDVDEFPVSEDITAIRNNKSNSTQNENLGISITKPSSINNKSTVVDPSNANKVSDDVNISLNRTEQLNISKTPDRGPVTSISINKSKSQNKSTTNNKSMNSSNPRKVMQVQSEVEEQNLPHKSGFSHEVQANLENELENLDAQEEDLQLHYESEEDPQGNEVREIAQNEKTESMQQLDKESDELSKKDSQIGNLSLQSKTKAGSEVQDEYIKKSEHERRRTENQEMHNKNNEKKQKVHGKSSIDNQKKHEGSDMDHQEAHEDSHEDDQEEKVESDLDNLEEHADSDVDNPEKHAESDEANQEEHEVSDVSNQDEHEESDMDDQEKREHGDENIQEESDEENENSGVENKDEHIDSIEANHEESDVDNHEEHEEIIVDNQEASDEENQVAVAESGEDKQDEENEEQNPEIHDSSDEENIEEQVESAEEDQEEQNESEEEGVEEQNDVTQEELDNCDQEEEENQEAVDSSAEIQDTNEDDEQNGEGSSQEIDNEDMDIQDNALQDTTGRQVNSPEAILHIKERKQMESFVAKDRNTSLRRSTIMKSMTLRTSLAPPRESTGFSDGTKNSSAEGSGWDSHRTTRKTLRQTFGKDFSPRKSLRALVMEKSAKRLTTATDITSKFPQGNSTELPEPEASDIQDDHVANDFNHDVSKRTRQTTLELYLQKIKRENMERKIRMEEAIRNSLKRRPKDPSYPLNVPSKTMFPLKKSSGNQLQTKSKPKQIKSTRFDNLPPEMIEDMKYKPPKRFGPRDASWITKRLYKYLETKLEPKYDYKARLRSEKLVETVYNFSKQLRRHKVAPNDMVDELKYEMARLDVVKSHFEFYQFFHDFMPREIRIKVVPDVVNKIPVPRHGIYSDILRNNTVQG